MANIRDGKRHAIAWRTGETVLILHPAFGAVIVENGQPREVVDYFRPITSLPEVKELMRGTVVATARYNCALHDPAWKMVEGEAAMLVWEHVYVNDRNGRDTP